MNTTLCWRCSNPYKMTAHKCPKCGAVNGNHDMAQAQAEAIGPADDLSHNETGWE